MINFEINITINTFLSSSSYLLKITTVYITMGVVFIWCNTVVKVTCQIKVIYSSSEDINGTMAGRILSTRVNMGSR